VGCSSSSDTCYDREERVQRERAVGGEARTGGRMPWEIQRPVREAQSAKGSI
jgi:hypothetical protein